MKTSIFTLSLFFFLYSNSLFAQLPLKPEEISPLLVGETIPSFSSTSHTGQKVDLIKLVKQKPTVLVFYRGGWCPFCNKHLSALGEVSQEIEKLGYQIVAMSPDDPIKLKETNEKGKLSYILLSDSAGAFSKLMGIAFQAPEKYSKMLSDASGGRNSNSLPVPALFVLDKQGMILFEHIDPNYKTRISSKLLLAVLEGLK